MTSGYGVPRSVVYDDLDLIGSVYGWSKKEKRVVKRWGTRPGLMTMPHDAFCHLGECLLIAPKVTLPVTDDQNGTLRMLVNVFGLQMVRDLLDSGAIEFLCVPEYQISSSSTDLEECFQMGVKGLKGLDEQQARELVRLALQKTTIVKQSEITDAAIDRYIDWSIPEGRREAPTSDYDQRVREELRNRGEAYEKKRFEIAMKEAFHSFTSAYDVDFYEKIHPFKTVSHLRDDRLAEPPTYGISASFASLLKQEQIPSVRDLIDQKLVDIKKVALLRDRPEVVEFRHWLWGRPDPFTAADVTEAYRRLIVSSSIDFSHHSFRRFARITLVSLAGSAVGAGIGTVMAGPVGSALGAGAGLLVSLADGFCADMVRKENPRHFAALIREESIKTGAESNSIYN